jgi:hypothetical protein
MSYNTNNNTPETVCIVCGKPTEWFEPRFLYYCCEEHRNVPPTEVHNVHSTAPVQLELDFGT